MKILFQKTESKRYAALILCIVFFICSALTGCSHIRRGDEEANESAAPSASLAPTSEPENGGTLRLPMPVNAPCSDPLEVNTEEMLYLFSLVYDTLLTVNGSGEIEPCLCESWTSEGNGVWLLHLRDGVRWHDNSGSLRAHDVLSTYRDLCEMEDSYYKPCLKHIISIDAVDLLTLRVRLDISGIMGLYSLVFPIRKAAPLIGTGCYKLESMKGDTVVLKVNEDWWDRRPYIDRIIFEERDTNTTALASFEAGQLNMIPTDIITAGRYSESGVTNVYDIMTQSMETLLFNFSNPVFNDVRVRLAVAHGINRSRIITNVYSNRARAADVPIPPDSWLCDSRSAVLNYDPELSKELIAEAGYTVMSKEGLLYSKAGTNLYVKLLTCSTTENTVRSEAAAMIASQLSELGFLVDVVTYPHVLGDKESEFLKALREGDWDIALVGFNLSLGNDLSSYLDLSGTNNFGHIADSELSSLDKAMRLAENEEDLRSAAYDLQSAFVEAVPFVTLYFRLNSVICSAYIMGVEGSREPLLFYNIKDWYISRG